MRSKKSTPFSIKEWHIELLVFVLIFSFLIYYYKPELMLSATTTTGGDMSSDLYPAKLMKEKFLPEGKIFGWDWGWYVGMPMLQFYFPISFVLVALLSNFLKLEVAFKIISIMGTFLMPVAAYIFMRFLRFSYPIPIIAALFALPFLFIESYSIWGGNIPSTLAGEYSYQTGMAFSLIFLGLIWRYINEKKFYLWAVLLFSIVFLYHVYDAVFSLFTSLFFLISFRKEKIIDNAVSLFKVYAFSISLIAFWALPMVFNLEWTTPYADVIQFKLTEVFPVIVLALMIFAIFNFVKPEARNFYPAFSCIVAVIFTLFLAEAMGTVNVRFLPFLELMLLMMSASGVGFMVNSIFREKKDTNLKTILPLAISIIILWWTFTHVTFISSWINWNYSGFEAKQMWKDYKDVNDFLSGGPADPRVVFEHSGDYNSAGTPRVFEMLPYFSGRSTTEGLFMQSSHSSPFVFYIQSEVSKEQSCPFWRNYPCTQTNLSSGIEHMKMFNVKHYIVHSSEVRNATSVNSEIKLVKDAGVFQVYELLKNENKYVTVPKYEPVFFEGADGRVGSYFHSAYAWKNISYQWFKSGSDVHLTFKPAGDFKFKTNSLDNIPRIETKNENCKVEEEIKGEEILVKTNCVGKPHIIRTSYFPNWQSDAGKIYLASPSFMLIYPNKSEFSIKYKDTLLNSASSILSLLAWIIFLLATTSYFVFSKWSWVQNLRILKRR